MFQYNHPYLQHIFHHLNLFFCNEHLQVLKVHLQLEQYYLHNKHIVIYYILYPCLFQGHKHFFHIFGKFHASTNCISFHPITSSNSDLFHYSKRSAKTQCSRPGHSGRLRSVHSINACQPSAVSTPPAPLSSLRSAPSASPHIPRAYAHTHSSRASCRRSMSGSSGLQTGGR
mgnify:CR=1 FL=1